MSRTVRIITTFVTLVLLVTAVGCQEKNKGMSEQEQAALDAQARIADLQAQLDAANQQRMLTDQQLKELMAERDRLAAELAKAPEPVVEPAPGWKTIPGGAMISIEGTVLFDSGKAKLRTTAKGTLDSVAKVIREQYSDHDVYVFGHTDNQPIKKSDWDDNYELSCHRALSVLRYLKGRGVANNTAAGGWGDQLPVVANTSATARQKNRRVEIYAMRAFKDIVQSARAN
jgi:chemotaxis protein MotB